MHNLRIEGRKIFLDEFELKDVSGYELKADATSPHAELTVKITVRDIEQPEWRKAGISVLGRSTLVTVGDSGPEVVKPFAELEELLRRHFGDVTIKIGEAELGRVAIKAINEAQRGAGRTNLDI